MAVTPGKRSRPLDSPELPHNAEYSRLARAEPGLGSGARTGSYGVCCEGGDRVAGEVEAPHRASGCFRGRIRQRRASGRRMRGLGFPGMPSIDAIAAEYVDRAAALDPFQAALAGIDGHDHEAPA